jgi:hypothetical protein
LVMPSESSWLPAICSVRRSTARSEPARVVMPVTSAVRVSSVGWPVHSRRVLLASWEPAPAPFLYGSCWALAERVWPGAADSACFCMARVIMSAEPRWHQTCVATSAGRQ